MVLIEMKKQFRLRRLTTKYALEKPKAPEACLNLDGPGNM
jgi:hypothetical protein